MTCRRGDSFSVSPTGLGNLTGYAEIYFTVKAHGDDTDAEAAVQIVKKATGSDGLLYINGEAAQVAADGSITINNQALGNITITLKAVETAKLEPGSFDYDIELITSAAVTTLAVGAFIIPEDYTRATS